MIDTIKHSLTFGQRKRFQATEDKARKKQYLLHSNVLLWWQLSEEEQEILIQKELIEAQQELKKDNDQLTPKQPEGLWRAKDRAIKKLYRLHIKDPNIVPLWIQLPPDEQEALIQEEVNKMKSTNNKRYTLDLFLK